MTSTRIVTRYDPCMPLTMLAALLLAQVEPIPVAVAGKPFAEVRFDATKPYVYPIRTASGKVITRRYPMETVAGETTDHPHHRGMWFSHGDVNGWDFWANEPTQKGVGKGRGKIQVKHAKLRTPDTVSFQAEWLSPDGVLIQEDRQLTFRGESNVRAIDVDITLTARTRAVFGDTKEGVFAIRLRDEFTAKQGGWMTNAEGLSGMKEIWGKPSPWVEYVATLEGEPVAVRIADHLENPRHPTRWHARDYGLFAANIFGVHDFLEDKSKDGSITLAPGESLRFRYTVTVGPPSR
jgi:hypothetical protein